MITFDEKKYPQITDAEIKDALQFSTEQVIRDLPEFTDQFQNVRWIGIASAAVNKLDYAASGGIHSPEGIVKAILAGASAVEICSAFYQNSYALVGEYIHFLNLWMDRKGMENIPQFKGMLNVSDLNGVNTFERTQFMKYFSSKK